MRLGHPQQHQRTSSSPSKISSTACIRQASCTALSPIPPLMRSSHRLVLRPLPRIPKSQLRHHRLPTFLARFRWRVVRGPQTRHGLLEVFSSCFDAEAAMAYELSRLLGLADTLVRQIAASSQNDVCGRLEPILVPARFRGCASDGFHLIPSEAGTKGIWPQPRPRTKCKFMFMWLAHGQRCEAHRCIVSLVLPRLFRD